MKLLTATRPTFLGLSLALLTACGGANPPASALQTTATTPAATTPAREARRQPVNRGLAALERSRFREAISWFDEALDGDPNNADALTNRAVAHLAVSEPNRALEDATAAAALSNAPHVALNLANIQIRVGLFDLAEPALRTLVADPTVGQSARLLLGIVLVETGRLDDASEVLGSLQSQQPESADVLNALGVAYERIGQLEQAVGFYDRAIGADPEHLAAWRNLGMAHARRGDDTNAERALERYLLTAPFDSIDRGVVQGRLDRLRNP